MQKSVLNQDPLEWVAKSVLPLWSQKAIEPGTGLFIESLDHDGNVMPIPMRSMVQARQIFSFQTFADLGLFDPAEARQIIERAASVTVALYQQPSGAFVNSVTQTRRVANADVDLYAQAFGLFGLAYAFKITQKHEYKIAAEKIMAYLKRERRGAAGGYTEIIGGKTLYQSNPHMHLFEAALTWMDIDTDPMWRELADELVELCLTKFISADSKMLSEHFDEGWRPLLMDDTGLSFFEPGHHYEWSWLLGLYQQKTGRELTEVRKNLFELAEKYGIKASNGTVVDQVSTDGKVRLQTSRFWPQCERIKAAVLYAQESKSADERQRFENIAIDAMNVLFKFFQTKTPGTWYDTWLDDGTFSAHPVKASSPYHIMGAIWEFQKLKATPVNTVSPS